MTENPTWMRDLYGVPIAAARDARSESRAAYRRLYDAAQAGEPLFRARFNIYLADGFLIYLRESCAESDTVGTFAVSARAVHPDAVAGYMRDDGFANKSFGFWDYGAFVGGACLIALPLPTYPLESLAVSYAPPDGGEGEGGASWSGEIPANRHLDAYARAMESAPATTSGGFNVYADEGALTYVKAPCAESDARGRFFLSVFPANPRDLPQTARDAGLEHEPLNFDFYRYGGVFGDKCVIVRDLPDYPISRVETGQFISGEGEIWSAEMVVGE